jgi:hypothetical protein
MLTRRFEQIALAQILAGGFAVVFSACVLIEHAQAQPGYVPPPTPAPPPVLNPSSPNVVPQPSYRPLTPSTPSTTPSTPSNVPSTEVTPPANEEHPSTTTQSEPEATTRTVHHRHHHRGRFAGLTWPYYCGSSPCVRIHPRVSYGYAAPYASSTLLWPGFYDYAPGQFGRGRPRYGGYGRRAGYRGD